MVKRMLRTLFIVIVSTFISVNLYAQSAKCTITGKLVDENKIPIAYASVAIFHAEKPIIGMITDDEGKFSLKVEQHNNK